jgi:hypothetical protein
MQAPSLKAIFHRQIDGDHALLQLAQSRFQQACLAPEYYPGSPEELRSELRFHPSDSDQYTVHLPRDVRILDRHGHDRICAFAAAADRRIIGFVVHDQPEVASRFSDYVAAARQLDDRLRRDGLKGLVFIEYAAGLEPGTFIDLHWALRDCPSLGACIDISHIGIRQCQRTFEREHPGVDVCQLKSHHAELQKHVDGVQSACRTALPVVVGVVHEVGRIGKLLHFHLHDGHPSSTFSAYGVSDHLSFFREIPIPFGCRGRYRLPTLYGPTGLWEIVAAARRMLPDEQLSFTLEIHPTGERQQLGEHEHLFRHWRDRANAERMNYWIEELLRNHQLLQEVVEAQSRCDAISVS